MKCRYEGNGVWTGRCTGTKEVDPCPGYDKCKSYKPCYATNADRIRAMTDEELAELLEEVGYDLMEARAAYWLKWLQQPAEEG